MFSVSAIMSSCTLRVSPDRQRRDRLVRQLRHDAAVRAQLALVKRGLHQPALPPPQLAFADDQALADARATSIRVTRSF